MRAVIVAGVAAVFLVSCGSDGSSENRAAGEENVASEIVATNDVTAIDAATGEAANMAADVQYMPEELDEPAANGVTANTAAPSRRTAPARTQPRRPAPEPRTAPAQPATEPAEPSEEE